MVVGRMNISPSEMVGNSSGNPPAAHTPRFSLGHRAQMRVAVVQFAPRIADPDDRLVLKGLRGETLGAQPRATREIFVRRAVPPFLAAEFPSIGCAHEVLLSPRYRTS